MAASDFWEKKERAQTLVGELSKVKAVLEPFNKLAGKVEDFVVLAELAAEEGPESELLEEADASLTKLQADMDKLEMVSFLGGRFDKGNAIITLYAGQGGTESCDWAAMLFRMYTRWIERNGFKGAVLNVNEDVVAGIKSASILVEGPYAYGYLCAERGVHRLVRISPYDSNARRQTSFASLDVSPEIADAGELEIDEKDIEVKFTRSSGAGGQHVNTTDSACQIKHIPTGIQVNCQNERSSHQNKATAMTMLRSKLYELQIAKAEQDLKAEVGAKMENAWGSQIRSYVLHPYQMVKDLRTDVETSNTGAVLDGDINMFIEAWIRMGKKSTKKK